MAKRPKMPKANPNTTAIFHRVLPADDRVIVRPMFGIPLPSSMPNMCAEPSAEGMDSGERVAGVPRGCYGCDRVGRSVTSAFNPIVQVNGSAIGLKQVLSSQAWYSSDPASVSDSLPFNAACAAGVPSSTSC